MGELGINKVITSFVLKIWPLSVYQNVQSLSKSITFMLFGKFWLNEQLIKFLGLKLVYITWLQGK